MQTSIGYHTFVKSRRLTSEDADRLFEDFKKYRNTTGEIEIIKRGPYKNDPNGRHYSIVYPNREKGISWRIRFSNRGFTTNGQFTPCSIKVTINPKVLVGEKTYIVAADARYLDRIEEVFNSEAQKISPVLGRFHDYSLNRIDYCVNFDVSEVRCNCPPELTKRLPGIIMELIRQGDIPTHFSEEYGNGFQFYLKSKSVVINCYWKYNDLLENFSDCRDLDNSYNIIRFEIQYRYPKAHAVATSIKREHRDLYQALREKMSQYGFFDFVEDESNVNDDPELEELKRQFMEASRSEEATVMEQMLSDKSCFEVIEKYLRDVIKPGAYYTFDVAKRQIEKRVTKWEKVVRLTETLKLIRDCEGITKAKATLKGRALDDFRRSLRELEGLGINPVTIPDQLGIEYILSLLDIFYMKRVEKLRKEEEDRPKWEILKDYMKDCKKRGESWL